MKLLTTLIISLFIFTGCSSNNIQRSTIRDIDFAAGEKQQQKVFIKPKSNNDIRKAYADYLKHATKDDKARINAINRLAELEFELSNKLQKESENLNNNNNNNTGSADNLYNERVNKTIELLTTSLNDYPNAKGNDKILYRLAKAYNHIDAHERSKETLQTLVKKHPKSRHYIESQFRLAEIAFSNKNYIIAEDTYTDIIGSRKNNVFYEKSLFKRGWARFKQEYYLEAVDDYLEAVDYHNFDDYNTLSESQLEQFNEYFRAIGLSFSYLGGAEPLNEYFKNNPDFKYIYYSYSHVSDIYLKQLRYSDAVDTLKFFIKNNQNSKNLPVSHLKIIDIWKKGGFAKKSTKEINILYKKYHPSSPYWLSKKSDREIYNKVSSELKNNILLASSFYHKKYQANHKSNDFSEADKWYKRYLKHYNSYARKDNIYYQYANLLEKNKKYDKALKFYELAAYDDAIILNKEAAYSTILLTNKIYNKTKKLSHKKGNLNKHIKYAALYAQLYPNSKRTQSIILHAAELAFQSKQYDKAIGLAESISNNKTSINIKSDIIKAHSYFKLEKYESAEAAYFSVLSYKISNKKLKENLSDKLALAIYKQAENSAKNNNLNDAIDHYMRISSIAPHSSISATGMYDAIALSMKHKLWDVSIENIKKFKQIFPKHKYSGDITKKLSVAYLNSNQSIKAAQEFEKISGFEKNKKFKIAALWQAAELYESKNDINSAIRSYEKYSSKYKKPYPQYIESLHKLAELYEKSNRHKKSNKRRKEIINADKKTIKKYKTDRTRFITSLASINLAKAEHQRFSNQKLVLPLKLSLRKKKYAMQKAVRYYGQASKYGIAKTATESTYAIAEIYESFSQALLASERPKGLNRDELEQYVILLEDKAFPFEDKAIEFYEANMSHIKDGVYNNWVKRSHNKLKELFPVRYKRTAKLDGYINALH